MVGCIYHIQNISARVSKHQKSATQIYLEKKERASYL
jgi:hypothetical protein